MKSSKKYQLAAIAVIAYDGMCAVDKLEIIETLLSHKILAEFTEKQEEEE